MIEKKDMDLFKLVDDADEALEYINYLIKNKKITTAKEQSVEYTSEVKIQK